MPSFRGFFRVVFCCCLCVNLDKAKKQAQVSRPAQTWHATRVNPTATVPGNVRRRSSLRRASCSSVRSASSLGRRLSTSSFHGESSSGRSSTRQSSGSHSSGQQSASQRSTVQHTTIQHTFGHPSSTRQSSGHRSSYVKPLEPVQSGPERRRPVYQPTRPGLQPKKPTIKLAQQPLKLASQTLGQQTGGQRHVRFASVQSNIKDCNTALYHDRRPPPTREPEYDQFRRLDVVSLPPYRTETRFRERKLAGESPWAKGEATHMTTIGERRTGSRSSSNDVFYPTRQW